MIYQKNGQLRLEHVTRKMKKVALVRNGLIFDTVYPESGWIDGYVRPEGDLVPIVLDDEDDWSKFTPRIGVEYQANNGLNVLH